MPGVDKLAEIITNAVMENVSEIPEGLDLSNVAKTAADAALTAFEKGTQFALGA